MENLSSDELSSMGVPALLHILYLVWVELQRRLITASPTSFGDA